MNKISCALIVTTPLRCNAREMRYQAALLRLLEQRLAQSAYALNKIILLGGAGLVAAKSHHAFAASASLQRVYRLLAQRTGSELLLCGQSAAHYGLRNAGNCAEPWHLTGYMDVLAQLGETVRGGNAKVICLNSTTTPAALEAALLPADASQVTALQATAPEKGMLRVCFTFPPVMPLSALAMARTLSTFPAEAQISVDRARQYEWIWRWEQGLNLLLNAAELELPVAAYFIDLRLLAAQFETIAPTLHLGIFQQSRYRHYSPAQLLPQLTSATLVKQLRQLELYEIKSYFCGSNSAGQSLSAALEPLELQAIEPLEVIPLLTKADWPVIVV